MAGRVSFSILDNSEEYGSFTLHMEDLDAVNVIDYTNDTPGNAVADMRLAVNDLIIGNHVSRTVTATTLTDVAAIPADPNAQRERKAMVTYVDNVTTKKHRFEIPTFNMVGVVQGTDVLDVSGPEWQALITELEANWTSPLGNPITFLSARHVGRAS